MGKCSDNCSTFLNTVSKKDGVQVMVCETREPRMRSEIVGWSMEDSSLYVPDKPIGFTPSLFPCVRDPETILQALAEGWRLLGPPQKADDIFEWWLTREA
jgi:hypothetical protein